MNCLYKFLLMIVVTSLILFIPQKKSQPIHASETSYHTEYGIVSFDHSQNTDQLFANIEKNLPDFFIIHNVLQICLNLESKKGMEIVTSSWFKS